MYLKVQVMVLGVVLVMVLGLVLVVVLGLVLVVVRLVVLGRILCHYTEVIMTDR